MKQLFLTVIFVFTTILSFAQHAYTTTMSKAIADLKSAKTHIALQAVVTTFEQLEKNQPDYLPAYYAAQGLITMSIMESESTKSDLLLDRAQQHINIALKLQPTESEIQVLQGLLYQARIRIDMENRGQQFSGLSMEALEKAKALNRDNPRIYYLQGQNAFYTPSQYGGGPEAAHSLLTLAQQKFQTFKPTSALAPDWGNKQNQDLLQKCTAIKL